jgi:hypothetical protein
LAPRPLHRLWRLALALRAGSKIGKREVGCRPIGDRCAKPQGGSFAHLTDFPTEMAFPRQTPHSRLVEWRRRSKFNNPRTPAAMSSQDEATTNASLMEDFAPPPGRNPEDIAPPPLTNLRPANDLPRRGGAKSTDFRPTKKRKKFGQAKSPREKLAASCDRRVLGLIGHAIALCGARVGQHGQRRR